MLNNIYVDKFNITPVTIDDIQLKHHNKNDFKISKLQSLFIVHTLDNLIDINKRNEVFTAIIKYIHYSGTVKGLFDKSWYYKIY